MTLTSRIADEIYAIAIDSEQYPVHLKKIANPPQTLYARGNLALLDNLPSASIVGTRDATPNGLKITDKLTQFLVSECDAVIVSGLALGIDAQAHQSCLDAGGKTIAVLAHGLHTALPKQNERLAYDILDKGGLWVSEHPSGTSASRNHFVPRNRIQVGLSRISIVVEASAKSGTTTHAKFCVQENHSLFVVMPQDGNPLKLKSEGAQMMVRDMSAIPLYSRDDYQKVINAIHP